MEGLTETLATNDTDTIPVAMWSQFTYVREHLEEITGAPAGWFRVMRWEPPRWLQWHRIPGMPVAYSVAVDDLEPADVPADCRSDHQPIRRSGGRRKRRRLPSVAASLPRAAASGRRHRDGRRRPVTAT